ncbi:MAG: DUF362 domain-containing protein [Candidatus Latescibacter sp.]|nr:DUF362 domain-containing protein [Candidatus Latescibacter sp.]
MNRAKVAVLNTAPETVLEDYSSLLDMAGFSDSLSPDHDTAIQVTLDWHHFFPSVSTPPWQLDGVLKKLHDEGFPGDKIFAFYPAVHGVSFQKGQVLNRHLAVLRKYATPFFLFDENTPRVTYEPKTPLRVFTRFFPDGIPVPERLPGSNILQLTTMKTSLESTITGAIWGALVCMAGGKLRDLLPFLDEALCDAVALRKEMHPGMFAVMDGVFAGEGPSPRNLIPHEKNLILASTDPVALDAVALYLMGFEPLDIRYIRMAHESGLGTGDISEMEIAGADIKDLRFRFTINETPGAARVRRFENMLSGGFLSPLSELVSTLYYDWYWYLAFSEERIKKAMKGGWGKVFETYRR